MNKFEKTLVRLEYIIFFIFLFFLYEAMSKVVAHFLGEGWVLPIISGLMFTAGLIFVNFCMNNENLTDYEEKAQEGLYDYNYIVIDTKNKTTKLNGQIVVERKAPVTKNDISEIEKEWEIVGVFPAYILEPDSDDADINKIKELTAK